MLTEEQLLRLFMQQNIPMNGRRAVENIRSSEPVRRVGGGTHNVVARFASRKMGVVIQAESHKVELPAVYMWEHDPETHEFYDQPSRLKLAYRSANGRRCSHLATPDYFLIQERWMGWVECKTEEELRKMHESGDGRYVPDGNGGWRCPPGEEAAAQYGLGFKVRSSAETNWILVRNLEFLSDYLGQDCPQPSQADYEAILGHFGDERWMRLQDLLEKEGVAADMVFALVATGRLFVDIEQELLAEPAFTQVCKDVLSAKVYRERRPVLERQLPVSTSSIILASGTRILWDGQPWRILNVGGADVYLEDEGKAISTLSLDAFQSLVAKGVISGVPGEADQKHALADQIMRKAAPVDLEKAISRAEALKAGTAAGIPARTLRYWRKRSIEGELAYGNRFAGLIPRVSARGNRRRKVDSGVIKVMNEVIDAEVLSALQPGISMAYGMVRNLCEERGLTIPSEKTFRAEIKRRRADVVALARQGRKASYALTEFHWTIDQSTPRHGERPFEVGHIDHTELDIELIDSRTGANIGRPWLTILYDANTRMVLAFFLTFDPPSYRSCMAVIRNCVRSHGRIPKTIVVDQGSEFESLYFEALLARLETHKKSRPASKARFGSVIERFFGVNNKKFIHNLTGNNQALQKPRSMSPSHDPRKLAVWTLPALTDAFEHFVGEAYANFHHPALGLSPKQAMARGLTLSGSRGHRLIPYTPDFDRLCMPATRAGNALVRSGRGIKIRGVFYWHAVFRDPKVVQTKVPVVYDPFDVSRAYALAGGEWVLCRSEHQAMFERRTEREIAIISQEIRALHALAEIKRGVNSADMAAFISKSRESEAVMLQQRRDAERRADVLHSTDISLPDIPAKPWLPEALDPWDVPVALEIFEEIQ